MSFEKCCGICPGKCYLDAVADGSIVEVPEPPTIDELAAECYRISAEHGFHDEPNPLPQSLMLIVSEVAEALEAFRDDQFDYDETKPGALPKPQGVMSELADVVIRTLDTALEVERTQGTRSLSEVIALKMAFNETRPVGHGRVRL